MDKKLAWKICKKCGCPEDYFFDNLNNGETLEGQINVAKRYVSCVRKVEREYKNKK